MTAPGGEDVVYAGVADLAAAYRAGRLSPVEVAEAHLRRIEALNARLCVYVTPAPSRALEAARRAEGELRAGLDRGALQGIPYAVKDQVMTAGLRTTAGSPLLAEWIPATDATVVRRMDAAGAVLLGKLNMMEFALGRPRRYAYGTPRNPWNPAHETGGSSSGSGSAPAAGMATVTIGEDTGGSIRHPAAHCGVVGLRPTWGLVSRYGMIPAVWHMDTLGPLARTVEDAVHVMRTIAGHDPHDPMTSPDPVPDFPGLLAGGIGGVRVGLVRELLPGPGLTAEALQGVHQVADALRRLGATLREVSVPLAVHAGVIYTAFAEPAAAQVHLPGLRRAAGRYDPNVRVRLARGLVTPAAAAQWAYEVGRRTLVAQISEALSQCDVLLAPTTPGGAPRLEEVHQGRAVTEEDVRREFALQSYRMPFSFHGGPVLAVCCGFTADGLPLSVQFAAAPGRDGLVLRVGHAYQQVTDWHRRRPDLGGG